MSVRLIPVSKLRRGQRFGVFSPSDPIYRRRIPYLRRGIEILREWGFTVDELTEMQLREWSTLRSSIDRAEEFNQLITDPKVGALIATWGGKNSSDILPFIAFDAARTARKPVIGSSDIGVLLNALVTRSGIPAFYGPNVLGKLNQTTECGFPLLRRSRARPHQILLRGSYAPIAVVHGHAEGRLVGGSLGTFTLGLAGTSYMPSFERIIFFFESASLELFQVRQHLRHLELTGFLNHVAGVFVGAMTKTQDHKELDSLLLEFFAPKNCAVIRTDSFGHGQFSNPTIPLGALAELSTTPCSVRVMEAIVE